MRWRSSGSVSPWCFSGGGSKDLQRKCSCSAKIVNLVLADEQLNLSRLVTDIDKLEFPFVATKHDASGGSDWRTDQFAGALCGQPFPEFGAGLILWQLDATPVFLLQEDFTCSLANVTDQLTIVEATSPRIDTHFDQTRHFDATCSFQGIVLFVVGDGHGM